MRRLWRYAALALLIAAPAGAAEKSAGKVYFEKIEIETATGARTAHVEAVFQGEAAPVRPPPLLILFHDAGQRVKDLRRLAGFDLAEKGWTLAWPRGEDRLWNVGRKTRSGIQENAADDVGFIAALVDRLAAENLADPRRVFLVGMGEGGLMVQRLICEPAYPYAGAAMVMATYPVGYYCQDKTPLPLVFFHGLEDKATPYQGGRVGPRLRVGIGAAASVNRAMGLASGRNGCAGFAETRMPGDGGNVNWVRRRIYAACRAPLLHYGIVGAGHHWPGARYPGNPKKAIGKYGPLAGAPDATKVISSLFESLARR